MKTLSPRASLRALLLGAACAFVPAAAHAADDAALEAEAIIVNGTPLAQTIENAPATQVSIDAEAIRTKINAVSIEDALKYAPSLAIRKRSIGDNFAPIATRTSGLGSSARSVILADGALLSAFIGNNNGNASPKWQMVAAPEVARIDVLYGPFSAAYAGNSIGTVVNITTRTPDKLEAEMTALVNQQWHKQYTTSLSLPTGQLSGYVGDRLGRFAFVLAATHTVSNGQPIVYVTAAANPAGTSGGIATLNRLGQPIRVLGASDIDHHVQDTIKAKLSFDLTDTITARYNLGLFLDSTSADIETYLARPNGDNAYTTGFNSGLYLRRQTHLLHTASLDGEGSALQWQVIGTLYDYAKDRQASPLAPNVPAAAFAGGPGTVQRQDGTGWWTLDAKAALRSGDADEFGLPGNVLSFGAHGDRYKLISQTFNTANWQNPVPGLRTAASFGRTRTAAVWVQDALRLAPGLVLNVGGRQEWWKAFGGFNQTSATVPGITQPTRTASRFSPKATLEFHPAQRITFKASFGQAWRFPTVGELYQASTVGTVLANPNPNLRPERARSIELAAEYRDDNGLARISLFNEVIKDALISQAGSVTVIQPGGNPVTTAINFVQNVDRTRARGVELALDRRNIIPDVDLSASLTLTGAITSKNSAFPASVGKLLPSVPRWKGNAVATWHPTKRTSLTAAMRFSSRNFATLDNSDVFADTYQGFDKFFVVDLRGTLQVTDRVDFALGIDNVNNARYFLFHPFPQRSVTASLHWKL